MRYAYADRAPPSRRRRDVKVTIDILIQGQGNGSDLVLLAEVVADVRLEGRVEERVVLGPHAREEEDRRQEHGDERDRRPEANLVVADLLERVVLGGRRCRGRVGRGEAAAFRRRGRLS